MLEHKVPKMNLIKVPCRVERDEVSNKVVFAIIDGAGNDVMVTPCCMNWDLDGMANMQAVAEAVCSVLNAHLAQSVVAG